MSDLHTPPQSVIDRAAAAVPAMLREDALGVRLGDGVVGPDQLLDWVDRSRWDVTDLMRRLLPLAATLAHAPISDFHVGCVVMATVPDKQDPALFLGGNFEFPGTTLMASVHAEQAAVTRAALHDAEVVVSLAVTAPPCGHCRQFLSEVQNSEVPMQVHTPQGAYSLEELLPKAFAPSALGVDGKALGFPRHEIGLVGGSDDPVVLAALGAAAQSYVPYSRCPAGIALALADGRVITGRSFENAAYNPSVSPAQSAFAIMGAPSPESQIRRAVLVECEGSVSHERRDAALLASIAPETRLERVLAATHQA